MKIYDIIRARLIPSYDSEKGGLSITTEEDIVISFEIEEDANEFLSKCPGNFRIQERELVLHSEFDSNNDFGIALQPLTKDNGYVFTQEELNWVQSQTGEVPQEYFRRMEAMYEIKEYLSFKGVEDEEVCRAVANMDSFRSLYYDDDTQSLNLRFNNNITARICDSFSENLGTVDVTVYSSDRDPSSSVVKDKEFNYLDTEERKEFLGYLEHVSSPEYAIEYGEKAEKIQEVCDSSPGLWGLSGVSGEIEEIEPRGEDLYIRFNNGVALNIHTDIEGKTRLDGGAQYSIKAYDVSNINNPIEIGNLGLTFNVSFDNPMRDINDIDYYLRDVSSLSKKEMTYEGDQHFIDKNNLTSISDKVRNMIEEKESVLGTTTNTDSEKTIKDSLVEYHLNKIDGSHMLSTFVSNHAASYVMTGEDTAKITFDSGCHVYVSGDRFVPYQVIDDREVPLHASYYSIRGAYGVDGLMDCLQKCKDGRMYQEETAIDKEFVKRSGLEIEDFAENVSIYRKIKNYGPMAGDIAALVHEYSPDVKFLNDSGIVFRIQGENSEQDRTFGVEVDKFSSKYTIIAFEDESSSELIRKVFEHGHLDSFKAGLRETFEASIILSKGIVGVSRDEAEKVSIARPIEMPVEVTISEPVVDSTKAVIDERVQEMENWIGNLNYQNSEAFGAVLSIPTITAIDYTTNSTGANVANIYFENGIGLGVHQAEEFDANSSNPALYKSTIFVPGNNRDIEVGESTIYAGDISKLSRVAEQVSSEELAREVNRIVNTINNASNAFNRISHVDDWMLQSESADYRDGVLSMTFNNGLRVDIEITNKNPGIETYNIRPFLINNSGQKEYLEDLRSFFTFTDISGEELRSRNEFRLNGYLATLRALDESVVRSENKLEFQELSNNIEFFKNHLGAVIMGSSNDFTTGGFQALSNGVILSDLRDENSPQGRITGEISASFDGVDLGKFSYDIGASDIREFFREIDRVVRDVSIVSDLTEEQIYEMKESVVRDLCQNPIGDEIEKFYENAPEMSSIDDISSDIEIGL